MVKRLSHHLHLQLLLKPWPFGIHMNVTFKRNETDIDESLLFVSSLYCNAESTLLCCQLRIWPNPKSTRCLLKNSRKCVDPGTNRITTWRHLQVSLLSCLPTSLSSFFYFFFNDLLALSLKNQSQWNDAYAQKGFPIIKKKLKHPEETRLYLSYASLSPSIILEA